MPKMLNSDKNVQVSDTTKLIVAVQLSPPKKNKKLIHLKTPLQ